MKQTILDKTSNSSSTIKPTSTQKSGFTNFKNWSNKKIKDPIFWVKFSAYAVPAAFLIYVLYMNFLPFGYHKTFVINVGSATDTSGEFYLAPSQNLSERKISTDGTTTYRELNGTANVIFNPKAVLKNADITVSVEGDGVSIIPPYINFDPSTVKWDYNWDFTKEIPKDLTGNAFMFDGAAAFNGRDTRLDLPNSVDKLEDGPLSIYAEWTPMDSEHDSQQIVGHYNWELWQNKNSVEFMVGRMNDTSGPFYSIKYPVNKDFFNMKHSILAIYNSSNNGYIELFIDGNLAGISSIGKDQIWADYGNKNITFGKADHGIATYFTGSLYQVNIATQKILLDQPKINFTVKNDRKINITIVSSIGTILNQIKVNATQK